MTGYSGPQGNRDLDREILFCLDVKSILIASRINKYLYSLRDNAFWKNGFLKTYNIDLGPSFKVNYKIACIVMRLDSVHQILWAAEKGYTELVSKINYSISRPKAQSIIKRAILYSFDNKHYDIILLLAKRYNMIYRAFCTAAQYGNNLIIKSLMDIDSKACRVEDGDALINAAKEGHTDIVKILIDHGVKLQRKNKALILATTSGHTETVKILLNSGADINSITTSVLNVASNFGHIATVESLRDAYKDS